MKNRAEEERESMECQCVFFEKKEFMESLTEHCKHNLRDIYKQLGESCKHKLEQESINLPESLKRIEKLRLMTLDELLAMPAPR